ncbi:Hypothetical protein R9X50_00345500 [Acrodontium crateriforme]|uniref:Fungal N-terminal domain-containing protein n=1 Tax=Acrodontium crateriforme TaxID=150365 RepID=A0AAQ3M3E1_9PEZI|nr:Hypothetical protein R9X50_00345500 [Acrodontium crateriforme]
MTTDTTAQMQELPFQYFFLPKLQSFTLLFNILSISQSLKFVMSGAEAIVGVVSGGAGLISLSIQLLDSAKQLKAFCEDIKNAPEILEITVFSLETMAGALEQIECQTQHGESARQALIRRCLKSCRCVVTRIVETALKMQKYMNKFRMGKFLVAFDKDGLDGLLKELDRARASLHLVLDICYDEDRRARELQLHNEILSSQGTLVERLSRELQMASGKISQQTAQQVSVLLIRNTSAQYTGSQVNSTKHERIQELDYDQATETSVSSKTRLVTAKRSHGKRTTWLKHRFILPHWLSSCVWDIAVLQADSGWTAYLQTYNIIPSHSDIFWHCGLGDIQAVDRLIRSGEGTFLDCRTAYGSEKVQTLLQCAAEQGQIEMCEYLLDQAPWPDTQEAISISKPKRRLWESQLGFFHDRFVMLAIEKYGYEFDAGQIVHLAYAGFPILKTILTHLPSPMHMSSELEVLKLVRQKIISPREISILFDIDIWDVRLAGLRDQEGWSALHLVAFQLCFASDDFSQFSVELHRQWEEFGSHLIRNNAELHDPHMSPLFYAASHNKYLHPQSCEKFMQQWASLLSEAGIDLLEYGKKEHIHWDHLVRQQNSHGLCFESSADAWGLKYLGGIYQMKYGKTPADWRVQYRPVKTIPIFRLHHPPGAFSCDYVVPRTILWDPNEDEQTEGHWIKEAFSHLVSRATYMTSRLAFKPTVLDELMDAPQDDTSIIPLLISRRLRNSKRRSSSQPSPRDRRESYLHDCRSFYHSWLKECHLCPFDGKYRSGCGRHGATDFRSCLRGLGDPYMNDYYPIEILTTTIRDTK